MKETKNFKLPYFKFEVSDWNVGTIQDCSRESKGLFIDLCALYWARLGELNLRGAVNRLHLKDESEFSELIEEDIIQVLDGQIIIEFLDEQISEFSQVINKRRKAAQKRWSGNADNQAVNAHAMHMQSKSNAHAMLLREDKIREEKEKSNKKESLKQKVSTDKIDYDKLLALYNQTLGKQSRVVNAKTRKQINARLKEGYTKRDLVTALNNAAGDSFHMDNNYKYLTLEFISRADKLDKFLNANQYKLKTTNLI